MKQDGKDRGANGTRDPRFTVTLDSGSHINVSRSAAVAISAVEGDDVGH